MPSLIPLNSQWPLLPPGLQASDSRQVRLIAQSLAEARFAGKIPHVHSFKDLRGFVHRRYILFLIVRPL